MSGYERTNKQTMQYTLLFDELYECYDKWLGTNSQYNIHSCFLNYKSIMNSDYERKTAETMRHTE